MINHAEENVLEDQEVAAARDQEATAVYVSIPRRKFTPSTKRRVNGNLRDVLMELFY